MQPIFISPGLRPITVRVPGDLDWRQELSVPSSEELARFAPAFLREQPDGARTEILRVLRIVTGRAANQFGPPLGRAKQQREQASRQEQGNGSARIA